MPKPTYKKPREQINSFEESTWHANATPFYETEQVAVFKDLYPCTEGHLLFIPKQNEPDYIAEAYKLAYRCGEQWMEEEKIDGFNVGQNRGKCAGQTIMWPHVHFIPRKDGDIKNGQKGNGIRLSFPNGDTKNIINEGKN